MHLLLPLQLVLDFFDGMELLDYTLDANSGQSWLSEGVAQGITVQLLEALVHVHSVGLAHLDLKPQNVLYRPTDGRMMLIDFGASAAFELSGSRARLVQEHGGTQNYMSPERHFEEYGQIQGEGGGKI